MLKWQKGRLNASILKVRSSSLSGCGLVNPHFLLWDVGDQRAGETALEALREAQVRLESHLVGPQQSRPTSRPAKMTHGAQQLLQAAVVINHVGRQHVVVVVRREGEVSLQVLTPGERCHLWGVARPALSVPHQVKGQIRQDIWQVGGCDPGT